MKLLDFQPKQPLPSIRNLSNTRISFLPEVEKFLVMLYGVGLTVFLEVLNKWGHDTFSCLE